MAAIAALPEEIIEIILRQVKDICSPDQYWSIIRACKAWHRIGLGTYDGIHYATSTTLESIVRRHHIDFEDQSSEDDTRLSGLTDFDLRLPSPLFITEVKSLTVHVRHARIAAGSKFGVGLDFFSSLAVFLRMARKLRTFSLKFASEGWAFPASDIPAVLGSKLALLVVALPETVVDLELDTAGVDVPPTEDLIIQEPSKHLCQQMSRILPRLHNLRLRVSHICGALLPYVTPLHSDRHNRTCNTCLNEGTLLCGLLSGWNMRSMTVWFPPQGDGPLTNALGPLLKPSVDCSTSILLINQLQDDLIPNRMRTLVWVSTGNIPRATRQRLSSWVDRVVAHCPPPQQVHGDASPQSTICSKAGHIAAELRSPIFVFPNGPPNTDQFFMPEWSLESSRRWTQFHHLGPRLPVATVLQFGTSPQADLTTSLTLFSSNTPASLLQNFIISIPIFALHSSPYPCLFPSCTHLSGDIFALRGHHAYAHPDQAHEKVWYGHVPCPAIGCDRVGERGFREGKEAMRKHVKEHYLPLEGHEESEKGDSKIEVDQTSKLYGIREI